MMVVVLIVSPHCLVQSAVTTMSVQEQDKIRQYLYSTKDDFSSFNLIFKGITFLNIFYAWSFYRWALVLHWI